MQARELHFSAPPGGRNVPRFFFLRVVFATNDPYGGAQHSRRVRAIRIKTVGTSVTNPRRDDGRTLARSELACWRSEESPRITQLRVTKPREAPGELVLLIFFDFLRPGYSPPRELGSIPPPRAVVQNAVGPWYCAAGVFDPALLYTKPSTTFPARAWAERHHPGVAGEPAAGCIPSVPPVRGWLGPAQGEFLAPRRS
jgi:hypothetical protein